MENRNNNVFPSKSDSKTTEEKLLALENSESLSEFLSANDTSFQKKSSGECLSEMIREHGVSKSSVAKGAGMNYVYLYQILAGIRNPSRNRVICIGLGIGCSFEEIQSLLRKCGYAELNLKFRRDTIIIYGILHGKNVFTINDILYNESEELLF